MVATLQNRGGSQIQSKAKTGLREDTEAAYNRNESRKGRVYSWDICIRRGPTLRRELLMDENPKFQDKGMALYPETRDSPSISRTSHLLPSLCQYHILLLGDRHRTTCPGVITQQTLTRNCWIINQVRYWTDHYMACIDCQTKYV